MPARPSEWQARDMGSEEAEARLHGHVPTIDPPTNPLLLSPNTKQDRAGNHDKKEHHKKCRDTVLRRWLAQLPLRQNRDRRRHHRLERIRRGIWRARSYGGDRTAVGAGGRQERISA